MTQIVEMADDEADRQHDREDEPVVAGCKEQRVVVAEHQEDDRQRQVVVVH